MKREIGNVLRRFVNICCYIFIIMVIIGPVLHILEGINNTQIEFLTICAGVAALSSLVFISSRELQGAAWWGRELICLLINIAVVLPLTHYVGLWHSILGMITVIMLVIIIAFGNHLVEFIFDMWTAKQINNKISDIRHKDSMGDYKQ